MKMIDEPIILDDKLAANLDSLINKNIIFLLISLMASSINPTNQFDNLAFFKAFYDEIPTSLNQILSNLFIPSTDIFIRQYEELWIETFNHCKHLEIPYPSARECYLHLLSQKDSTFNDIHDRLVNAYFAHKMTTETTTIPIGTTVTIPVCTTYETIDIEPIPFTPVEIRATENHLVVDGLNFLRGLQNAIITESKHLGFMDYDRNAQENEIDGFFELRRVMEYAKMFFNQAIPSGTRIHIVMKKFGNWNDFIRNFVDIFGSSPPECSMFGSDIPTGPAGIPPASRMLGRSTSAGPHKYDLYIAKQQVPGDKECDDRLVDKLAFKLNCPKLSNDQARSRTSHFHLRTNYYYVDSKDGIQHGPYNIEDQGGNPEPGLAAFITRHEFKFQARSSCIYAEYSDFTNSINYKQCKLVF